jgi:hypothetical protein
MAFEAKRTNDNKPCRHCAVAEGLHDSELLATRCFPIQVDALKKIAAEMAEALLLLAPQDWLDDNVMDHMPGIKEARAVLARYDKEFK